MAKKSENKKRLTFTMLDELFNEGNLSIINQTCSENIARASGCQEDFNGIEAFQRFVESFHNAFADIHLHIDEIHEEGDLVDAHATLTATNIGKFLGMPATQKEVTLEPVFFKFDSDGKVVEFSQEMDIVGLMEQSFSSADGK
jgi:predicted ester cyclase